MGGRGEGGTHRIDAQRVRALEHPRHARVQLQDTAAPDHAVTATERGARGEGVWGGRSPCPTRRLAAWGTYFQSAIFPRSAGAWLALYMADTFQPEPKRLTDLEKQSL